MKVKELIEELSQLDPELALIIQKDSEGNGFSPLSGVDGDAVYVEENSYSGTVYSTDWTAEDADMDGEEWLELLKKPRVAVLFPIN